MRRKLLLFLFAPLLLASAEASERWSLEAYVREAFTAGSRLGLSPEAGDLSLLRYERPFSLTTRSAELYVSSFMRALERAVASGSLITRFDAGALTAEDALVAARYDGPYRVGSAFMASLGWRYHLNGSTFLSLESMFTAHAYPRFLGPPGEGVNLDTTAVRIVFGFGQQF